MVRVGFHASHEQISPRQLLADVQHAEQAGFAMAMCSDHLAPWSRRQGHAGNTWTWLGAALARTAFSIGTLAIPGSRFTEAATLGLPVPGESQALIDLFSHEALEVTDGQFELSLEGYGHRWFRVGPRDRIRMP